MKQRQLQFQDFQSKQKRKSHLKFAKGFGGELLKGRRKEKRLYLINDPCIWC